MDMPYFFSRSRAPVRSARLRRGPGGTVESVVPDPGLRYKEAEATLLESAKEEGLSANEKHIQIKGDPAPPPPTKLVSYPGKAARTMTRRDRD